MSLIHVDSDRFVCEVSADAAPAIEVEPGSTLKVHCRNACDNDIGPGPVRAAAPNPATGPIAVKGARPGHAVKLTILDIAPEPVGYIAAGWKGGFRAVQISDGHAVFSPSIRIPLAPNIGVLGVAPPEGSWGTMECGPYGGNLDTNDITVGAAVCLPAFRPGGLFVLGDVHAVMADGEIGGQGLEVAADVTLRVELEPKPLATGIYLYRNDEIITIGTGETLDLAARQASRAMIAILERAGILDEFAALKFLGLAGQLRIGQQCCRLKSARVAVPLRYVPALRPRA